jgi:cation-transporting ATPase 13A3/4/5
MFRPGIPLSLWLLLFSSGVVHLARADFGDYADYTFECPSKTTCPLICVANFTDCPTACDTNDQLCADGTCIPNDQTCSPDIVDPCACTDWVACAKVIDFWPSCNDTYGDYYDNATACAPSTEEELLTFREPSFIFFYSWITGISAVIVTWCFFNQVLFPVKGSTRSLDAMDPNATSVERKAAYRKVSHYNDEDSDELDLKKKKIDLKEISLNDDPQGGGVDTAVVAEDVTEKNKDVYEGSSTDGNDEARKNSESEKNEFFEDEDIFHPEAWTQSGFRRSLIPFICFFLVVVTLIGIQILLMILTIDYYIQQGNVTLFHTAFQSDVQALQAFEIAWGAGFAFTLILRWPYTIYSLFLRRCNLSQATHVAIFTPYRPDTDQKPEEVTYIRRLREALSRSYKLFTTVMSLIFCDLKRAKTPGKTVFIPVEVDPDGTKFFFFRYRRYNFDYDLDKFVPGVVNVGTTLGDFRNAASGLSTEEAAKRRAVIGPNSLRFQKPNFFRCVFNEFCKPFYTYQCFMVWSWFPFFYYYMALVETFVITTGGFVVSYFRYRQDCTLFKLSETSGEVTVLRNEVFETINQTDVVPGDVIVVKPGITCCDLMLVASDGILVDESALTGEATPVAKKAVDPADAYLEFNRIRHKKHMLSAGTTVLECGEGDCDLAVVTGTGSFTAKGELLRDILSYERYQFKFDTEVKIVIFILFLYAVFGFAMVTYFLKNVPTYAFFYGM